VKVILCDVDGVLADFVGGLCIELSRRGFAKCANDIKHWDLKESLSPEETRAAYEVMSVPGFCHGLAWYEGARDFFAELVREGDVLAVTAPFDGSETWERERKAWMAPAIERKRVLAISGDFKHHVRGDVLIEDHPKTAHDWLEANPDGIALLIDRPWNGPGAKEWHMHARMYRVKSYDDALTTIRECA
jgi:5'(3')-deoxyribonucleotidase